MCGIIIDSREDGRIASELSRFDFPVHTIHLDHGDACWSGSGPSGPVLVGFEHKRLTDLIACIKDRRLTGSQLVGMWTTYDRVEIVIEGVWRPSPQGTIEVLSSRGAGWEPLFFKRDAINYAQVDGYLQSLSECGDVRIWRTSTVQETAHLYASRYHWWQKAYHLHDSHRQIYSNDPEAQKRGKVVLHQGDPSPVCQVAAQFPGIDAKSWSVAEQYGSVYELVTGHAMEDWEFRAAVARWQRTHWTDSSGKDKRFGRKTATEIVNWLGNRSRKV
jgi:hypothetical protein